MSAFLVALTAASTLAAAQPPQTEPVRINIAEGIIEPFWDPPISGFPDWVVADGVAHGLRVFQNWAAVDFEWVRAPEEGPVLHMQCAYSLDVSGYDTLIFKMTLPKGVRLRLTAETDSGAMASETADIQDGPYEYALPLENAKRVSEIAIALDALEDGPGAGWIEWIGAQDSNALAAYAERWDYSAISWARHIKGPDANIDFTPTYGIFMTPDELAALRASEAAAKTAGEDTRFQRLARDVATMDFGAAIGEFAKSGGDDERTRDRTRPEMPPGTALAEAGLALKNYDLLAGAARYALACAVSPHWDRDFRPHFPGGPADDRAFRRSYISEDIAIILDLAGEVFTTGGKQYLLRRLVEEGVGPITYVTWRHEYVHETNQLAYFNQGRLFALLIVERAYPRARPYSDLAMQDTIDNLNTAILPDGGYAEGPNYFGALARRNYTILKHFARARNLPVEDVLPASLRRTADYAAALTSTTKSDVIATGDSKDDLGANTLEAMVELMPGSHWETLLNKKRRIEDGADPLDAIPQLPPFIAMPDTGFIASHRFVDDLPVKLLILGNPPHADHAHEDKGSFVLEFAGETFAMDPGSGSYSDPIHQLLKQCQRHNMLVPIGLDARPAPPIRLEPAVIPTGQGDEQALHARIDATPGWEPFYKRWIREWDSPTPDRLTITDTYALKNGTGIAFYWQTQLPCEVVGNSITIRGNRGQATLTAPEDCAVSLETLPMPDNAQANRIAITRTGQEGVLQIEVHLTPLPN